MSAIGRIEAAPSPCQTLDEADQDGMFAAVLAHLEGRTGSPWMRCGGNLKGGGAKWSAIKERDVALGYGWIATNTRDHWNDITVDCDHVEWLPLLHALKARGVPDPTLIVLGASGRAHITWSYRKGKHKGSAAMRRLHEGIYEALRAALNGDPHFRQYLTKNPLNEAHDVVFTGRTYEFRDLLGPLIATCPEGEFVLAPRLRAKEDAPAPASRKCELQAADLPKGSRVFEVGRKRVYRRRSADLDVILGIYGDVASELGSPIKPRALQGMARRTARWMAAHPNMLGQPARDMRGIDGGVMAREAEARGGLPEWRKLDVTSKRVLAAERTNAHRLASTVAKLHDGAAKLWNAGQAITRETLAEASGVSLATVKRAWGTEIRYGADGLIRSNPFSPLREGGQPGTHDGGSTQLPVQEDSPLTWRELAALSRERAARHRREQDATAAYGEQAARMRKRGAAPERVPPVYPGAPQAVVDALKGALAALRDCRRRAKARRERAEGAAQVEERKADFRRWAEAGDTAAWRAFLDGEAARWNSLVDAVAGDRASRDAMEMRRGVAFKRHWTAWRTVLAEVPRPIGDAKAARPEGESPPRHHSFRTVPDRLDILANSIPLSTEAAAIAHLEARQRAHWYPSLYGP